MEKFKYRIVFKCSFLREDSWVDLPCQPFNCLRYVSCFLELVKFLQIILLFHIIGFTTVVLRDSRIKKRQVELIFALLSKPPRQTFGHTSFVYGRPLLGEIAHSKICLFSANCFQILSKHLTKILSTLFLLGTQKFDLQWQTSSKILSIFSSALGKSCKTSFDRVS